jgi:ferrous iron transport protein B
MGTPPPRTVGVVALAGQPNVGKSTIFNILTGLNQHVGNWAGKTIEKKEGTLDLDGKILRIVDLPGTYSLTADSEEERVARDFIIGEQPDVVVMVADASALERNLYLLAELVLLPVPIVLALNMTDVAAEQEIHVEAHVLEAALGLPVIPLVATKNRGLNELVRAVYRVAQNPGDAEPSRPRIGERHRAVLDRMREILAGHVPPPYPEDWMALKLLEGDSEITVAAQNCLSTEAWEQTHALLMEHEDAILDVVGGRYEWIARLVRAAVARPKAGPIILTDRLDKLATHPVWGMAGLLCAFALVFSLTFFLAAPMQAWLDVTVVGNTNQWIRDALVGAPEWVVGLLTDGVMRGAGTVVTFLPVLAVFFTGMGVLEDTGYLARVAYLVDRFMHSMGLHGKSALPLFLGFGCNVPAVMGTRVIESPSNRLLTILLAPLVPCSARLTVLVLLAPAFYGTSGAFLVTICLVTLNLLVLVGLGMLLSHIVFGGRRAAFIMEMPLYHAPNTRTIGLYVWNNLRAFLRKAATLIVLFSVCIWALSSYPGPGLEDSILAAMCRLFAPLGELMGMDWRMLAALLTGFIAKENVIATLGILYGAEGGSAGLATIVADAVPPAAALAFLVVHMLFIPCVATVAVIRQETRSWGWTMLDVVLLLAIALFAGVVVYQGAMILGMGT